MWPSLCRRALRAVPRRDCSSVAAPVRLRFAPSPTGYLHLGGLRTVLFNHLLARKLGGKWVLRIEDTDQARYVEGAVENLLSTLKWAGLEFDQGPGKEGDDGPYFQSERKHIYDKFLQPLIDSGKAYHCFCTPTRLAEVRKSLQKSGSNTGYDRHCLALPSEEVTRRLDAGESSIVRFKEDLVYAPIVYASPPIEDFVLRKSDGLPTYHFANVVDDHSMRITHVLRGEEWLPSTPKHLALYSALGWKPPLFAHMPLLINPDGSKLSKRAGDVRVEDYINKGYEPEALLNFVALMGWSHQGAAASAVASSGEKEGETESISDVLSMSQLIHGFSIASINKSRAKMSASKLLYLNRAHLQLKLVNPDVGVRTALGERLRALLFPTFPHVRDVEYLVSVIEVLQDRIHTLLDIPNLGPYFFAPPTWDDPVAVEFYSSMNVEIYQQVLELSIAALQSLPPAAFLPHPHSSPAPSPILEALFALKAHDPKLKGKTLLNPLRHALTGMKVGAGIGGIVGVLGREESLKRLSGALEWASTRTGRTD